MPSRPKIAVVAGDLTQPRYLAMFGALTQAYDVCVYAMLGRELVDGHGTGLKLRLFDPQSDMPGYMRGLEEELASASAVIGLETSRLATFQAVRAARKSGIPLGVVVSEFLPFFYEKYANIRAIQFDICNKAERFWATSRPAADTLRLDEVPAAAISLVRPVVNSVAFSGDPAKRAKFRKYVGIPENDVVILFHQDLEPWNSPEDLLRAVAMVRRSTRRLRLLFVGNGSLAQDLKYKCHDEGLARAVMFLHQDPEPFLADLLAASDIVCVPKARLTEFHEDPPLGMLEAMASGAAPLVRAGSVAAEWAGDAAVIYGDDSVTSLAASLQILMQDPVRLEMSRMKARSQVTHFNTVESIRESFVKEVEELLASRSHLSAGSGHDIVGLVRAARADVDAGREKDALLKLDEAALWDELTAGDRSEILCCKGEALYGLGDLEGSAAAFGESLRCDDRNPKCLRGLGYVSWQGHSNEEALMFFKKAHSIKGDDPQTMLGIGLVYRRLGLTEEAVFWLEKCLAHQDFPPSALAALAQTCAQASRGDFGIRVLERVLDSVGEHKTLMMTLGQLYLNEGMTEEGQAMLQRALADDAAA